MKLSKRAKSIFLFLRKNYFLSLFILLVGLVGMVLLLKSLSAEDHELYVKVKVSQGLWWASTARPAEWYIEALKKGEVEADAGKEVAEILSVRYYPSYVADQFDVYLTLRINTTYNKSNDKYFFKRSPLTVASPIEFEFPTVSVSGTVMAISESPFQDERAEKTLILSKMYAAPAEFNEIKTGDTYFDGEETVFEIIKKEATDAIYSVRDTDGNFVGRAESRKDIVLTAKVKVKESSTNLIFGEEQILRPGKLFYGVTNTLTFSDFVVRSIQ